MSFATSSLLNLSSEIVSANTLTVFVGTLILGLVSGAIWAVFRRMTAWIWK